MGPDAQAPGAVDPRDAAAAGADRVDIHHRHAHRVAVDDAFRPDDGHAAPDERDVAAGAADVAGDEVFAPDRAPRRLAANHAGRRPGKKEPHGTAPRHGRRGEPAARLHHLQRCAHAELGEIALHRGQVAVEHRLHVGVEGGDAGALVLAERGVDVAGEGNHHVGRHLGDHPRGLALVRRIGVGKEECDGDGVDLLFQQRRDGAAQRHGVERRDDPALRRDPLHHALAQMTGGQEHRRACLDREVVDVAAIAAADLQHVGKAGGGQQAHLAALALEHRIGGHRGAVHDPADEAGRDAPLLAHRRQRLAHRCARVGLRGGNLEQADRALPVDADHIGERAADVDADGYGARHVGPVRAGHGVGPCKPAPAKLALRLPPPAWIRA